MVTTMGLMSQSWAEFWQALSDLIRFNGAPTYSYVLVGVVPALVVFTRSCGGWNAIADQEILLHITPPACIRRCPAVVA